MSTLLERCVGLSDRLERVASAGKDADLVKKLREIEDKIAGHVDRAKALENSFKTLRGGGVIGTDEINQTAANKQIQRLIETLRKRLRERRSEMTKGDTWKNLDQKAKSTSNELDRALKSAWRTYVKSETPTYDIFRSFSGFEQCRSAIANLEQLQKKSEVLALELPGGVDELKRIGEIRQEMIRTIESLDLRDVPDEVLEFLRSCSSGVSLNELTDEILTWLRDRGFTKSMKVTLRS